MVALTALVLGLVPSFHAEAAPLTTENACTNALSPDPSQIPMVLEGTGPASAPADQPFTVSGLKVTGNIPAAYIQAGVGLGLLTDGQTVSGSITVTLHATNATVADTQLSGTATTTVKAPGGVAEPLTVAVPLGSHTWTPTGTGDVALSQALTGTASGGSITNGSILLSAVLPFGTVKIACKPGTVTGTTATFATSTNPFVSVSVSAPTTSSSSTSSSSTSSSSTSTSSTSTSTSSTSTSSTSTSSTSTSSTSSTSTSTSSTSTTSTTTAPSTTSTTTAPSTTSTTTAPSTTSTTTAPTTTTTAPPKSTSLVTQNACTNALSPTPSQIPIELGATAPGSGSTGKPFTVSGLKVTGNLPAALVQAGIGLGLLQDGQVIPGTIDVTIHAVNATPADVNLTGTTSATIRAPGGVAQDLVVSVSLPDQVYTPTGNGDVTLSQARTGPQSAGSITNGSVLLTATLPGLGPVKIACRPGTVSADTAAFAAEVGAFVTVPVPDATLGATTSTTDGAQVLGTTQTTPPVPTKTGGTLPYTGIPKSLFFLVALGLALLDAGYLMVTATRPMSSNAQRRRG